VVSELFDASAWQAVPGFEFTDVTYHRCARPARAGTVRIAFDRPRCATRSGRTGRRALPRARSRPDVPDVGCVLLTGNGPSPRDGGWAFCSGGDQRIRGRSGYQYAAGDTADSVDAARTAAHGGRLHILEVQRLIRTMPKIVVAVVPGVGGRRRPQPARDLRPDDRLARARPVQADGRRRRVVRRRLRVGLPGAQVGQKFAREIFFLGRSYDAETMQRMGGQRSSPHASWRQARSRWRRGQRQEPDGAADAEVRVQPRGRRLVGQQVFAGEATRLAYMTDEAAEGRDSFLEKREPDWSPFPWYY
jgi:naphthoate synthase